MTRLALAGVTLAIGLRFGTFTAGGADSYGYVSQADLWLKGTLIIDQPLHDQVTWRWANWTLSPLGYRPGETGGTMVPVYPPGLPLLMAAFKFIGGDVALFSVVLLLGALTVWLTYRLGLRLASPPVAVLAAFAMLVSPVFLFHLVWPMSDVPATAWWLAAIVGALGGSTRYAVISGLAAAAAILTRPNLFPLAGLVLGLTLAHHGWNRVGLLRATAFAVAALPGPIAVAIVNNHLYGSPFASGYGTVETIYAAQHFATNILQYPMWLLETQTPFILLAFAAPMLLRRRGDAAASRLSLFALIFSAGVLLMYLWYTPYPDDLSSISVARHSPIAGCRGGQLRRTRAFVAAHATDRLGPRHDCARDIWRLAGAWRVRVPGIRGTPPGRRTVRGSAARQRRVPL